MGVAAEGVQVLSGVLAPRLCIGRWYLQKTVFKVHSHGHENRTVLHEQEDVYNY